MGAVSGQGTTFNLPNYHGELINISPQETPFLTAIGGLSGYATANSTEFEWQTVDLRDASDTRQRLEGADAPTAEERTRSTISNVVEKHQEKVEVSYTKQASTGLYSGINSHGGVNTENPVGDELAFQVDLALKAKKRDIEKALVQGTYYKPADNTESFKTRGIMEATPVANIAYAAATAAVKTGTASNSGDVVNVTSNGYSNGDLVAFTVLTGGAGLRLHHPYYVVGTATNTFQVSRTLGGSAEVITADYSAISVRKLGAVVKTDVDAHLQTIWENGGIQEEASAALMVGASAKRMLSKLYIEDAGYQEQTRNIGGVRVTTIHTEVCDLNLILSRYIPAGAFQVVSLEQCQPVVLPHPGRGFMYLEPLAKTGTADKYQLVGEIGLKYGNPNTHGRLLGLGL